MKASRQFSLVDRVHVVIGGDDRAQIGAERDPDRRAIVDRADAHLQRSVGAALRLVRPGG